MNVRTALRTVLPAPLLTTALLLLASCTAARPGPAPSPGAQPDSGAAEGARRPGGGRGGNGAGGGGPQPYASVITDEAISQDGLFRTHRMADKLYFEIPGSALEREMLLLARPVENSAQRPEGFFGGGGSRIVQWERQGHRVILREKRYTVFADDTAAIARQVDGMRKGPVIAAFDVEAYGPDSAAVVEVTSLYTTPNDLMESIDGLQRDKSWIEDAWSFPRNVEVEATQTGNVRPQTPGFGGPGGGGGGANNQPRPETQRMHWSMLLLPDDPMMARLHDERVGFNSFRVIDFGRHEHRSEERRIIRRFRLEKQNPNAPVSDPVEPIVYWIDPATPDWLKPWVVQGVDAWQEAFEEAGFSNAIFGRVAPTPEEDPSWSLYDARHSVIYWRPSSVPNATGGQIWDPRSGEILKGEVNMYHNVLNLLRNWYFIQASPLDARAQSLPLPDSLMGRMLQYVVTHEIGHSIGFPHNMKASAQYPADSIRSRAFLERMGGHVATLMDYSRFNYVAQPEDNIPPHLLIPNIGPYDRFAVKWGYAPIPGARTPDAERPTLDQWARAQDTIPWLRFSTADATNDPEDQTEAVGDADAVKSTTLALKNLERVAQSLIPVAERPGQSYDLLEELYDNTVQQWGRYMAHVASLVGGAITQEKYGTGPRFEPVSRERQAEAVRFLNQNAFRTPDMLIDPDLLLRIESEGVVPRIRTAQSRVLRALLSGPRLNRLVEYEGLLDGTARTYTVAELLGDVRSGVWGELSAGSVRIDVYRRNLQRAYLEAVDAELNPPERPAGAGGGFGQPATQRYNSDARAALRGELVELDRLIQDATGRAGNRSTRLHLRDLHMEIERILDPS
ncbi:MAG: zinc-dependent metalloprotease [Gemmatimonadota bacterium]|nr:zinc-dependent metalloprotease [Gemmatimonadota bacterium]